MASHVYIRARKMDNRFRFKDSAECCDNNARFFLAREFSTEDSFGAACYWRRALECGSLLSLLPLFRWMLACASSLAVQILRCEQPGTTPSTVGQRV
jgi:hypothetical protein